MNKLQAAMRDKAARSWKERKLYYKVGSIYKGCAYCGDIEVVDDKPRFVSGMNVFRSFVPKNMGWTYWCWDCGAKDLQCWANAADIGQDKVFGPGRNDKPGRKLLAKPVSMGAKLTTTAKQDQLAAIDDRITKLMELLKGGVK